jgi:hypothetical protein
MTAPSQSWKEGTRLTLKPREIAIYRDGVVVHRGSADSVSPLLATAHG